MRIVSVLENQKIEKRIAITPDIAKKYIALGFEVSLSKKYGEHLSFKDNDYKELGVEIFTKEAEALSKADIIVQLGLPSDDKLLLLKKDQILVGVFSPHINKEKIKNLSKKNINIFSLEMLPRITRAQSMDILSSQANLAGYKAVIEAFANFEKAIPMMMTAAGTIPAAVIIIGMAFSKFANDSITALYPARLAWEESISIDWALVILGNISKEKMLIFFLDKFSIFFLLICGLNIPTRV